MPVFIAKSRKRPPAAREIVKDYDSASKGLNTLLLDNELSDEEVVDATNLRLVGKGILEPRGGTGNFFKANTGKTVRMIEDFYLNKTVQLLTIGDDGWLTKQSGTSYMRINGASFASGSRPEMAQVEGVGYIVDGVHPMARFDGTTLLTYTQISRPTHLTATKSSGTTGAFSMSYRVSAEGIVGETLASDPVTLSSLPETLTSTNFVTLSWTGASPSSSVRGYVIYGREQGAQSYLSRVPSTVTNFIDDGSNEPSLLVFPPDFDSTAGPIAKHVRKYKGLLILANMSDDDSLFMWGGVGPNIDKFTYSTGGGYYSLEKESGDRMGITGISEREGKSILFKSSSVFQVELVFDSDLGINEPKITKLVDGVGCISSKTVQEVENSVMFIANIQGRGLALAKLDYEPNIVSQLLRFQPISARIQSVINRGNNARMEESFSEYYDKKYHWFIPVGSSSWICLVYDVERAAFVGPWTISGAWSGGIHVDSNQNPHLLFGKSDGNVIELSDQYVNDEGVDFNWNSLSKKDDFGAPFQLKIIEDAKIKLRNISGGNVNISYIIEGQDGIVSTAANTSAAPSTSLAGWGSRAWARFGSAWGYNPSSSSSNSNIVVKYTQLNIPNALSAQTQISGKGSRAQIISSEMTVRLLSRKVIPNVWR